MKSIEALYEANNIVWSPLVKLLRPGLQPLAE